MNNQKTVKVLFVCMGNICRSPAAHGIFRHLAEQQPDGITIETDSAGTHAYHVGESPDKRAVKTAQNRGININDLRARRVEKKDFEIFDYVMAMDRDNLHNMEAICPAEYRHKIQLFLDYATDFKEQEVPDPYYGGPQGFEKVMNMVEVASEGLLEEISSKM